MVQHPTDALLKNESIIDYGQINAHVIEVEKFTPMDRGVSPAYERNLYKMMGGP